MTFGEFLQQLAVVLVALAVAEVLRASWIQPEYVEDDDWFFEETEMVVEYDEPPLERERGTITIDCQPCRSRSRETPLLLEEKRDWDWSEDLWTMR
jgi:hypothetical protein